MPNTNPLNLDHHLYFLVGILKKCHQNRHQNNINTTDADKKLMIVDNYFDGDDFDHFWMLVTMNSLHLSPKRSSIFCCQHCESPTSVTKKFLPVLIEVILSVLISNCWFVSSANFTSQLWLDNWLFFPQIVFMPGNKVRF